MATDPVFQALIPELQYALQSQGYQVPTPIQAKCLPPLLEGKDLMGSAQTGTGKTAAFTLPLLQSIAKNPRRRLPGSARVLILTPTRELAAQVGESVQRYGAHLPIRQAVVFGGVGQRPQERAMSGGVDVLVATPGRLLDLMQQGFIHFEAVEAFVLDEADRMLDMGFIEDVRRVIRALPPKRQSLFFSATLAPEIVSLAQSMLRDPVRVTIAPEKPTVERIVQQVLFVDRENKDDLLRSILQDSSARKAIVFIQQKRFADRLVDRLERSGIRAVSIHGDKSQTARTKALERFRIDRVKVLVATDIAARGIDVSGISHVINYHLPMEPETYVHRIGRTARAGAEGVAVSFCSADERGKLRQIERLIRKPIPTDESHDFHSEKAARPNRDSRRHAKPKRGKGMRGGSDAAAGNSWTKPGGKRSRPLRGGKSGAPSRKGKRWQGNGANRAVRQAA